MHDKTIAGLSAGLAAGEFSSEEVTRAFLELSLIHISEPTRPY